MGGGVHCYLLPYIAGLLPCIPFCPLCFPLCTLLPIIRGKTHQRQGKRGKSYIFFGVPWCFLGNLGDKKGQNPNIFLKYGCRMWGKVVQVARACAACSLLVTGAGGRGCSCYFADVSKNGQNPLLPVAFLLCVWWDACKYAIISQI